MFIGVLMFLFYACVRAFVLDLFLHFSTLHTRCSQIGEGVEAAVDFSAHGDAVWPEKERRRTKFGFKYIYAREKRIKEQQTNKEKTRIAKLVGI